MNNKKKIVVIDDEKDLCELIKDNLENEEQGKFQVITVNDETKAEETCLGEKPDLILLDVVMPKIKGSEIAKSLKENPQTKNIPIIIMSGLGEMVYFKRKDKWQWLPNRPVVKNRGKIIEEKIPSRAATAYGVEGYIEKPFSIEVLIDIITDILQNKSSPDEQRLLGEEER